jgi:hypothetical protein
MVETICILIVNGEIKMYLVYSYVIVFCVPSYFDTLCLINNQYKQVKSKRRTYQLILRMFMWIMCVLYVKLSDLVSLCVQQCHNFSKFMYIYRKNYLRIYYASQRVDPMDSVC